MIDSTGHELGWWARLRRRRIRNYLFLNVPFQMNFAVALASVGLMTGGFLIAGFYLFVRDSFLRISDIDPDYVPIMHVMRINYDLFMQALIVVCVIYTVLLFLLGLLFSHRIAGPLFNITSALGAIARDDTPKPVVLRRSDLLMPFADTVNDVIRSVTEQRRELHAALTDAAEALADQPGKDTAELRERLLNVLRPPVDTAVTRLRDP